MNPYSLENLNGNLYVADSSNNLPSSASSAFSDSGDGSYAGGSTDFSILSNPGQFDASNLIVPNDPTNTFENFSNSALNTDALYGGGLGGLSDFDSTFSDPGATEDTGSGYTPYYDPNTLSSYTDPYGLDSSNGIYSDNPLNTDNLYNNNSEINNPVITDFPTYSDPVVSDPYSGE